ncbi:hypothetical protein [Saccharothrix algeriensis]|uniref:AmiR/NasT family two-component response regulator n=1 Tax=Saccharothrix algeriensis TaxID=173560 RepID=A0A8T8I712_9PSEU|nr:hypothetical protein [Saccharothrix algeriensis]MBM7809845.1 AmiR/NasT family two-component response regulator [Saccharothrix algeriensis]QTR06547.1 hypothetical protein J7S33_03765 [Saccharothrix algeriensis]
MEGRPRAAEAARRYRQARDRAEQPRTALASRAVIDRARGVLVWRPSGPGRMVG